MNLESQAESESPRKTRSKLEAHREAIFALRRKHWTHKQIAQWLNEHGVKITLSAVHRFCQRAIARRPRSAAPSTANPFSIPESEPLSPPPPPTTQNKRNYRFQIDI